MDIPLKDLTGSSSPHPFRIAFSPLGFKSARLLGKPVLYTMRGEENKIGFIDNIFESGNQQKYMWHFWSDEENMRGSFEVIAVKESGEKEIIVFEAPSIGGPNNGANAHIPSLMSLPEAGIWRLDAYINGVFFDNAFVKVK